MKQPKEEKDKSQAKSQIIKINKSFLVLFLIFAALFFLLFYSRDSVRLDKESMRELETAKEEHRQKITEDVRQALAAEAPHGSGPLQEEELSDEIIRLKVSSADGFHPREFKVPAGQEVILSFQATDSSQHTIMFLEEDLPGVHLTVEGRMIRAIAFWAPEEKGSYEFNLISADDVSDPKNIGLMTVY
jgi:plastocyanin